MARHTRKPRLPASLLERPQEAKPVLIVIVRVDEHPVVVLAGRVPTLALVVETIPHLLPVLQNRPQLGMHIDDAKPGVLELVPLLRPEVDQPTVELVVSGRIVVIRSGQTSEGVDDGEESGCGRRGGGSGNRQEAGRGSGGGVGAYKGAKNGFKVPGIGKLVLVNRKARMGRNPATGAAIKIPAKRVVKFRVAKVCKEAILG